MLAAATDRRVLTSSSGVTGTSIGAALLARGGDSFALAGNETAVTALTQEWRSYAQAWMRAVSSTQIL